MALYLLDPRLAGGTLPIDLVQPGGVHVVRAYVTGISVHRHGLRAPEEGDLDIFLDGPHGLQRPGPAPAFCPVSKLADGDLPVAPGRPFLGREQFRQALELHLYQIVPSVAFQQVEELSREKPAVGTEEHLFDTLGQTGLHLPEEIDDPVGGICDPVRNQLW